MSDDAASQKGLSMKRWIFARAIAGSCVLAISFTSLVAAADPAGQVAPHFAAPPPYTIYVVDSIYSRYNGVGAATNTGRGCTGPCTTSISESFSVANAWSASISFSKDAVQTAVGYSVTATSSDTYTNSFKVPSGKTGVIYYQDWYHVQLMDIHTATCLSGVGCSNYHYGTAWAEQWYQRIFSLQTS